MIRVLVIARMVWLDLLRRKDMYVLLILLAGLLLALLSLNIYGLGGLVRYVKDAGLLLAWLCSWILAISVASRQLPQEENRRTIFSLLAKPLTRGELLLGKWLGAWTVVCAATALFYLLIVLVVAARGGRFETATLAQAESGLRADGLMVLYYALPHLELFDMRQRAVHDWGPAPGAFIAGLVLYSLVWIALLLLLGWLGYRRKRFTRGEAR